MKISSDLKCLRDKTEARLREIAASARGVLGYSILDLAGNDRFDFNESNLFPQASAIKIPILMEVYRQADSGRFKLDDLRRVEKRDKTGGSGILAELGDGSVQMSIYDLCVLMIVLSDNTATNILIDLTGIDAVNEMLETLGLENTRLRRRMMDMAASARGDENLSTPAEAARIMELLYRGDFVSRAVCKEILAILRKPKTTNLGSVLPAGVQIASKPGGIAGVVTEWALVLLNQRPYAMSVMLNYDIGQEAPQTIKGLSKITFDYFDRLDRATPHGAYVVSPTPGGL